MTEDQSNAAETGAELHPNEVPPTQEPAEAEADNEVEPEPEPDGTA